MLTDTSKCNGLLHKPELNYNCDETGMLSDALNHEVVAKVGPPCITTNSKTQITVSAASLTLPPCYFSEKNNKLYKLTIEVPGTLYGLSDKG